MATNVELYLIVTRRVGIAVEAHFFAFLRLTCFVDTFEADSVDEAI